MWILTLNAIALVNEVSQFLTGNNVLEKARNVSTEYTYDIVACAKHYKTVKLTYKNYLSMEIGAEVDIHKIRN